MILQNSHSCNVEEVKRDDEEEKATREENREQERQELLLLLKQLPSLGEKKLGLNVAPPIKKRNFDYIEFLTFSIRFVLSCVLFSLCVWTLCPLPRCRCTTYTESSRVCTSQLVLPRIHLYVCIEEEFESTRSSSHCVPLCRLRVGAQSLLVFLSFYFSTSTSSTFSLALLSLSFSTVSITSTSTSTNSSKE